MEQELSIIGHVGADAEIKRTNGGKEVVNFNVACSEKYKKADGTEVTNTQWYKVFAFERFQNIVPYVKKGTLIRVVGKPKVSAYLDQQGQPQGSIEINAQRILLLSKKEGGQEKQQEYNSNSNENNLGGIDEDLPF